MIIQNVRYWVNFVKDIQTLYTAQVLKGAKDLNKIKELIQDYE